MPGPRILYWTSDTSGCNGSLTFSPKDLGKIWIREIKKMSKGRLRFCWSSEALKKSGITVIHLFEECPLEVQHLSPGAHEHVLVDGGNPSEDLPSRCKLGCHLRFLENRGVGVSQKAEQKDGHSREKHLDSRHRCNPHQTTGVKTNGQRPPSIDFLVVCST